MKKVGADHIDEEATEGPYDHLQEYVIEVAIGEDAVQNGDETGVEGAEVHKPRAGRDVGNEFMSNPGVFGEDEIIV